MRKRSQKEIIGGKGGTKWQKVEEEEEEEMRGGITKENQRIEQDKY